MSTKWYYSRDGQDQKGPVSPAELKALADSGELLPTDKVWKEGLKKWAEASHVHGLFASDKSVPGGRHAPQHDRSEPTPSAVAGDSNRVPTSDPDDTPSPMTGQPGRWWSDHILRFGILLPALVLLAFGAYLARELPVRNKIHQVEEIRRAAEALSRGGKKAESLQKYSELLAFVDRNDLGPRLGDITPQIRTAAETLATEIQAAEREAARAQADEEERKHQVSDREAAPEAETRAAALARWKQQQQAILLPQREALDRREQELNTLVQRLNQLRSGEASDGEDQDKAIARLNEELDRLGKVQEQELARTVSTVNELEQQRRRILIRYPEEGDPRYVEEDGLLYSPREQQLLVVERKEAAALTPIKTAYDKLKAAIAESEGQEEGEGSPDLLEGETDLQTRLDSVVGEWNSTKWHFEQERRRILVAFPEEGDPRFVEQDGSLYTAEEQVRLAAQQAEQAEQVEDDSEPFPPEQPQPEVRRGRPCRTCGGRGWLLCPQCRGTGSVVAQPYGTRFMLDQRLRAQGAVCGYCQSPDGRVRCPKCSGTGETRARR